MRTETPGRSRRLLTFRLDGELRQRLKTRLAGEGRTMSEVVILGLQLYVQRSAWLSGPGLDPAADAPPEVAETAKVLAAGGITETAGALKVAEVTETAEVTVAAGARARGTTAVASVGDLVLPDQTAAYLRDLTPTVGYSKADRLAYRCDRFYCGLPAGAVTGYQVIADADDCSDHRLVTATFDLDVAARLRATA